MPGDRSGLCWNIEVNPASSTPSPGELLSRAFYDSHYPNNQPITEALISQLGAVTRPNPVFRVESKCALGEISREKGLMEMED